MTEPVSSVIVELPAELTVCQAELNETLTGKTHIRILVF